MSKRRIAYAAGIVVFALAGLAAARYGLNARAYSALQALLSHYPR
jgi:hypothetical protein